MQRENYLRFGRDNFLKTVVKHTYVKHKKIAFIYEAVTTAQVFKYLDDLLMFIIMNMCG